MTEAVPVPQPGIIAQDEQTEIHVQAVTDSGNRRLDVRVWRHGPNGTTPSRTALGVEHADFRALQDGVAQLLEASNGGRQVARIVWDKDENRRLRAEAVPFGTRFVAKLVFWQRVRDSWRPVDDGLLLAADCLQRLHEELARFESWLSVPPAPDTEPSPRPLHRGEVERWPAPGGDWLTIEPDHIAFHPRGVRITCTPVDAGDQHLVRFQQWRRQETLWLTGAQELVLSISDLDSLLVMIGRVAVAQAGSDTAAGEEIVGADGALLHVGVENVDCEVVVHIEQRKTGGEASTQPRLVCPVRYLPQFGRMLLQSGSLLVSRMSPQERKALQSRTEASLTMSAYTALPSPAQSELQAYRQQHGPGAAAQALKRMMFAPVEQPRTVPLRPPPEPVPTIEPEEDPLPEPEIEPLPPPAPPVPVQTEQREEHPTQEIPIIPPLRVVTLTELDLGDQRVRLVFRPEQGTIALQWQRQSMTLAASDLRSLLDGLRDLYYGSLRGHLGRPLRVGTPPVTAEMYSEGARMLFALRQERNGTTIRLIFPAAQMPIFLDAAGTAQSIVEREKPA